MSVLRSSLRHGTIYLGMGKTDVGEPRDEDAARAFMKALLADVRALEDMLESGRCFEPPTRRIGAEQEMFLVDARRRPACIATRLLEQLREPRLTTELALFNLEANASPRRFEGSCLSAMEREIVDLVARVDSAARAHGAQVLLTGILPTLRRTDLSLANMTPSPRYRALNEALHAMRGGDFHIAIDGEDEIDVTHDNVMFEACNTSFQVHFQVAPDEFAKLYNVAQLATAPVLAAAVNSPVLLGSRLWHETRVALFSSSIDERSERAARELRPRVTFGDRWIEGSVLEIFHDQIARYRVVLAAPTGEDPTDLIARGVAPPLDALALHNGTVYRWNRAVYGVHEGLAHLRIENRALPSGPTVLDEMANAAFFFGLMSGLVEEIGDPREHMDFRLAEESFFAAARRGIEAPLWWLDGDKHVAAELITERLVPLAREGLEHANIDRAEIDRYLGVIEARVAARRTGASWTLDSLAAMRELAPEHRERRLVSSMLAAQRAGAPVHEWPLASPGASEDEDEELPRDLERVGRFMTTDLFTVRADDLVDLAASVMEWRHIKNVPVEDGEGRLVGLVTHRDLVRLLARGPTPQQEATVAVREIMTRDPATVTPDTPALEAMRLMRARAVGCLPVVENDRLVGMVTESDLLRVLEALVDRFLAR